MTRLLLDTSILVRSLDSASPFHESAIRATLALHERGITLHVVPQNLYELWVVATRPIKVGGLEMSPQAAQNELVRIRNAFQFLPDTSNVYPIWLELVSRYEVIGKPAHDARLVAAMMVHGIDSILTFDQTGFSRFPGIEVVHPAHV